MQWIDCFETQHMYEATVQNNDVIVDDECVASLTSDNQHYSTMLKFNVELNRLTY